MNNNTNNSNTVNISAACLVYIMPFQSKNSAGKTDEYKWNNWVRSDNLLPLTAVKTLKSKGTASFKRLKKERINDTFNNNISFANGDLICITMGDSLTKVSGTVSKLNKDSIIWWGVIDDDGSGGIGFNSEDGSNFYDFTVSAYEIGNVLDKIKIDKLFGWTYLAVNSTRGFDVKSGLLMTPPPVNHKKDSDLTGNCVETLDNQGNTVGVFYDSEDIEVDGNTAGNPIIWKRKRILEHLMKYSWPLASAFPRFEISSVNSDSRLLLELGKSYNLFSLSYAGALELFLPEAEWWLWHIDIDESNFILRIKNGADETPVDVTLDTFTESVTYNPLKIYDGVQIIGDFCYFTFTITNDFYRSAQNSSLGQAWSTAEETAWLLLDDDDRAKNKYSHIFRHFRIKSDNDGSIKMCKDIGRFDTDGNPINEVIYNALPEITYRGDLATKVDYSGYVMPDFKSECVMNYVAVEKGRDIHTGVIDTTIGTEFRDIGVYHITNDMESNQDLTNPSDKDLSGMSIKVIDGRSAVELKFKEQTVLGLNHAEFGDEIIDWEELYLTITVRSPQRVRCLWYNSSMTVNNPSGFIVSNDDYYSVSTARNILTVYDDELKFNAIAYGTIFNMFEEGDFEYWDVAGNFGTGSKYWFATRNDFEKAASRIESLKSWACIARNLVSVKKYGTLNTVSLGTYVNNFKEKMLVKDGNGDDQFKELKALTFVNRIGFDLRNGSETIDTTHISMPEIGSLQTNNKMVFINRK